MDYTNKTILVVEDEDVLLTAYKKGFEKHGFNVLTASDGESALTLIRNAQPDIVVMDLIMPIMNGEEVLEKMHEEKLIEIVPVIVITNKSDGASLYKCKKLGAKEYLIKVNVSIDEILEKINKIFAEKSV